MYPTTPCTPSTKTSRLSPLALPFLPTDTVIEGLTTVLLTRNVGPVELRQHVDQDLRVVAHLDLPVVVHVGSTTPLEELRLETKSRHSRVRR